MRFWIKIREFGTQVKEQHFTNEIGLILSLPHKNDMTSNPRFALLAALLAFPLAQTLAGGSMFYVSTSGNDTWSGRIHTPDGEKNDGPFATLERAADAVRAIRSAGAISGDTATIFIRQGTYALRKTLHLGKADGGSKEAPVVWRSYGDEKVVLTGGRTIEGFTKVTDQSVIERINPQFRDKILQINLRALGITDYGTIEGRGGPGMELFFDGKRMSLARYPNTDWLHVADVPQSGDTLYNRGLDREKRFKNVPVGRHYGKIQYSGDRPDRWSPKNEIYMHGYWTWDWSDSYQKVESIDPVTKTISIAPPHHHYGYTTNQRFYFLNVLEELDTPAEWYFDRTNGVLYFWPPGTVQKGSVTVSMLDAPLISLDSTSHVMIRDLNLAYSRGNGIVVDGGDHCMVAGCSFSFLGGDPIVFNDGSENGITGCDIFDVALAGVMLGGGDRLTLTPGKNFATNNHIHDYSKWIRTGQYAINISGVGNYVANNLIHDAPHEAIYIKGNEHLLEFNEVYRVCQETGDAGALHTGRDWTWRGNVIRYNYWHDLKGPGLHGVMGVYLDDWGSGFTVFGNVFYKAGRASFIGGGRNNTIQNNVYIDCEPSVHVDARGLGWAGYYFDGTYNTLTERMEAVRYNQPPYSTKYPELLTLYNDQPAVPKYNLITQNVSFRGRWLDVYDWNAFNFDSTVTMRDNVIADPLIVRRRSDGETGWDPYYLNIDMKEGYDLYKYGDTTIMKEFENNVFLNHNPGFLDIKNKNFQLKDDSPAFKLGFKRIPMEKIGLYKDGFRKTISILREPQPQH